MTAHFLTSPRIPSQLRAEFLLPNRHVAALTRLIGIALSDGDANSALDLATRRCGISPPPLAADHLLRAESARRTGDLQTAREAMRRACEIDPTDVAVNLGAILMLDAEEARDAARRLIATPTARPAAHAKAIATLEAGGERVVAMVVPGHQRLDGWVVWPAGEALTLGLVTAGCEKRVAVVAERDHPLATPQRAAATLRVGRPDPGLIRASFDAPSGRCTVTLASTAPEPPPTPEAPPLDSVDLTVIVPAYEDADRTAACLDSLAQQVVPGGRWRTIVVDDHSPNERLVADLARRASRGEITLLSHDANQGFAASVNAAAILAPEGDLLLLNADTLLPPGALARLRKAATEPGIGTLTPLSNNGELTSFPKANVVNDLPTEEELSAWDAAARAEGGAAIDVPSGVGFCLLVTRACWNAVGGLSYVFGRGYYEDVDLCLRARGHGFRNLCVPNVMVGHAGSRSFRGDKRALVVANEAILLARHPDFEAEYAAFLHAAPLRSAMARIERRLRPRPHPVLLVTANDYDAPLATLRRERLTGSGRQCLIASLSNRDGGLAVRLRSATDGLPQSITFDLGPREDDRELLAYLALAEVARVEILEPELCPTAFREILCEFGRPIDLHLSGPCPPDRLGIVPPEGRLLCSDAMAEAFAGLPPAECSPLVPLPAVDPNAAPARGSGGLAILSPVACAASHRLALSLASRAPSGIALRVLGATFDDLRLMAAGPIFAGGPVAAFDLAGTVARASPSALYLPYRQGQFFMLEAARAGHPCPSAYFDWSGGRHRPRAGDLALDPASRDEEISERVLEWYATGAGASRPSA